MNGLLLWLGRIAGGAGALVCALSAIARLKGEYFLGSFQVGTLLQAGTALMTFACLCILVGLAQGAGRR
jgi:hypothetical protein